MPMPVRNIVHGIHNLKSNLYDNTPSSICSAINDNNKYNLQVGKNSHPLVGLTSPASSLQSTPTCAMNVTTPRSWWDAWESSTAKANGTSICALPAISKGNWTPSCSWAPRNMRALDESITFKLIDLITTLRRLINWKVSNTCCWSCGTKVAWHFCKQKKRKACNQNSGDTSFRRRKYHSWVLISC